MTHEKSARGCVSYNAGSIFVPADVYTLSEESVCCAVLTPQVQAAGRHLISMPARNCERTVATRLCLN